MVYCPILSPEKLKFRSSAIFAQVLVVVRVFGHVWFRSASARNSKLLTAHLGKGNFTMVHGRCESRTAWYNPSIASSLFPSQLPSLSHEVKSAGSYSDHAYIKEDRHHAFDGGSSACAIMAAVSFTVKHTIFVSIADSHPCFAELLRPSSRIHLLALQIAVQSIVCIHDDGSCGWFEF